MSTHRILEIEFFHNIDLFLILASNSDEKSNPLGAGACPDSESPWAADFFNLLACNCAAREFPLDEVPDEGGGGGGGGGGVPWTPEELANGNAPCFAPPMGGGGGGGGGGAPNVAGGFADGRVGGTGAGDGNAENGCVTIGLFVGVDGDDN